MVISDYITPVMYVDPNGEAWWHWALAATAVVICAAIVVASAGTAAAGIAAVIAVGNGVAAATTASTVAAGAFIASSIALGTSAFVAATNSNSLQDFADQGNWGTVAVTVGAAAAGAYIGYSISTQSPSYYRAMSKEELNVVQDTGMLRGGKPGATYFTDTPYSNADAAQSGLSLGNKPDCMIEFEITNNPFIFGPSVVEPKFGFPGGGTQYYTNDIVEVIIKRVFPF